MDVLSIKSRRKRITFSWMIALIVTILFIINYYGTGNTNTIFCGLNLFCACISGYFALISICKNKLIYNSIYQYSGYGALFVFILLLVQVSLVGVYKFPIQSDAVQNISRAIMAMEILIFILTFLFNRYNVSKNKSIFVYLLVFIPIIINTTFQFGKHNFTGKLFIIIIISYLLLFHIKKKIYLSEILSISLYITLLSTADALYFLLNRLQELEITIVGFIKFCAYFVAFITIDKFVFFKEYSQAQTNLLESEKMQRELNDVLIERNKTLNELKKLISKSEKRYTDLISSIKSIILITNQDKIIYINNPSNIGVSISKLQIGCSIGEYIDSLLENNLITKKIKERIVYIKSRNENAKQYKINVILTDKRDFEVFIVHTSTDDKLIYINDVTEIKRSHKLKAQYDEYLKEEKVKDEFFSNISHELRTPINLIFSAIQLNEIYIEDSNYDKIISNNDAIKQNCLRLIRTINNFIDANKISEGYITPNNKVVNIVSVVENISGACTKYINKIKNKLIFDAEEEEIYVYCDKEMIERAVLNLLSNDVKYGKNNGTIFINLVIENDAVAIHIRSEHYTIDEEILPFMFDKFSKLNKSLNRSKEGSGLGLFLTKKLIEINGGTIDVFSDKENGSEFIIRLKITDKPYKEEIADIDFSSIELKVDTEFSDIYI